MRFVSERRVVPAEDWYLLSRAHSSKFVDPGHGDPSKPVPVHVHVYEGVPYTTFSAVYQRWATDDDTAYLDAHPLLPPESVADRTWQGPYEGLRVSRRGRTWVCGPTVRFLRGLPSRALPLAEAQAHDRKMRKWGWRSLWFDRPEITWHELQGHPVVLYREGDRAHAELNWRRPDGIIDFIPIAVEALEHARDGAQSQPVQPGLF
ncbi:hypothetical protein [Oceanithermus sp.]|uniref:hypothetical protein n=1 Tax=Oceanithermus sp. TaxID=2268145 RepID=UPI00257DC620|nr:hypothetical protein [Oceanithermus sp.]